MNHSILLISCICWLGIGGNLAKIQAAEAGQDAVAIGPEDFVLVEGGTFTMGCKAGRDRDCDDNEVAHEVTLSDFYIGKYEVTQAQWRQVMGSDPPKLYHTGCDQCPVESVSWDDIQEFLQKLNTQTGEHYRLPTDAEWEFAARGGNQSQGYCYSGSHDVLEVGWCRKNRERGSTPGLDSTTHPVGLKKGNELGIYDMSGNVEEWCADWYSKYLNLAEENPRGPESGSFRVKRGGSWYNEPAELRCANRSVLGPEIKGSNIGFRLVWAGKETAD
ncbi:formylglycine-generating enzyme family protein [Lewinella sp. LCG006]|uniref:formylglycine-generating enzyme family protein n=1 Tax=Lewinella sp. LCG006 TaxID=3231911 RepID=UPI0034607ED7